MWSILECKSQHISQTLLWSVLRNSGYMNGVTTIIGAATKRDNRYFMKRIPVNSHDDLRLFRAKLEGGTTGFTAFNI